MLSSLVTSQVEAKRRELEDKRHRQLVESHARIEETLSQLLTLFRGVDPSTHPSFTIDLVRDAKENPLVETPLPTDVPILRYITDMASSVDPR
ncbi:hypothetical protein Tco_0498040, partial [Tanacetum coccineum]